MIKSSKAKLFLWILSLAIGPVAYCVLLLAVPGTFVSVSIKENLTDFVVFWTGGFVTVWIVYWLSKFTIKYGPFM